jgi:signal transduction histidine kinase/ActR/RegA family two-component response regulator
MLLTGGALCGLMAALYLVVSSVMISGFTKVEARTTDLNVQRAVQALELAADTLSTKLSDWSAWDDTYHFVEDGNAAFIESNLTAKSLTSLHLNAMVFLRADRSVAHAVTIANESTLLPTAPPGLLERIAADPTILVDGQDDTAQRSGILTVGDEILVIASRPILNSEAAGPSHGILIFCESLTEERIQEIGDRLRMDLSIAILPTSSPDRNRPIAQTAQITPIDAEFVRGQAIVPDLVGAPALNLEVTLPRYVLAQALATSHMLALTLASAAVVCVAITLLVLRLTVLGRLARLHAEVGAIGSSVDIASRVSVVGHDELSHLAATLNDLLEKIANAHTDLASAKAAAERANRAKSEFLANMSHEVRTPLTAILGFSDLLFEQAELEPNRRESIDTIRRNGRHLLAVINDILDLSKIEAGRMDVEPLPCSPILIAREVIDLLRDRATQKGLSFELRIEGEIPALITTDPLRFRQIVLNLTGNALKFTAAGGVTLALAHDPTQGLLLVDVVDTGIGVTKEQERRLFMAFGQAESSTARLYGGTGLGLTISRKLAGLLGGSLALHATGPNGSTFRLTVATGSLAQDIEYVSQTTAEAAIGLGTKAPALTAAATDLSGLRILLAEDGPDNQRLISFVLHKAGATVEIAGDGQKAVDAVMEARTERRPFDLILMDIQLPNLDGFGATRLIRNAGVTTPILALTAHAMEGDRTACLAAGCNDYASKPIDRTALLQACQRLSRGVTDAPSRRAA